MGFEGEFASYEPLRRIVSSQKLDAMRKRFVVRDVGSSDKPFALPLIQKSNLPLSTLQPDLVLAIDGGELTVKVENGFPGAEVGYVTVASVLIDLKKIEVLETADEVVDPKKFRETERASTIDSVFPGCNVILDSEGSAKASMRKALFESLKEAKVFEDGETLLDTYEALLQIKGLDDPKNRPKSPIDDLTDTDMEYGLGEYKCSITGKPLYSTDALRLHELMIPYGTNGEMFGQIRATLEKLWFVHILRAFEKRGWLSTLKRVVFVLDGPLAVFSTSSWLASVIEKELWRVNDLQKMSSGQDLLIVGIEKSGMFVNHFEDIDTSRAGIKGNFPNQSALLLDDQYIKKNIRFSNSPKLFGKDTYFGRKFFYKTAMGQRIVPVVATFDDVQKDLNTASPSQFPRLADVMHLLDRLVSSRYPNSISPLISAHAEAAIPLNLGKKIFEDIAREIREKSP